MRTATRRAFLGGLIGLAVLLVGCMGTGAGRPADLDLATTRVTEQGSYRVSIRPGLDPIKVNQLHTWTLHVETADGRPVDGAEVKVDGDMPEHGHGLPTQPRVTRNLGNGDYLVEGMKFQMGGWWVMDFTITANGQTDAVHFNMMLQ